MSTVERTGSHSSPSEGIDRRLLERVLTGDDGAFAWLYRRHARQVFNFCYRTCGDRRLAAETTHRAFAITVGRLAELELAGVGVETYLLAIARDLSLDALRRAGEAASGPLAPEPHAAYADPGRAAATADHQLLIRSATARLTPRHRQLLALRDGAELPYRQTCEVMSQPLAKTARSLTRARLRLHEELRATAPPHRAVASECVEALPLLSLRVDGEIDLDADRWLASHLAGCETCTYNLTALVEARAAYRGWLPLKPPSHLARRVLAEEAALAPRRRPLAMLRLSAVRRLVAAGAASASLVLIGLTAWLTPPNQGTTRLVAVRPAAGTVASHPSPAIAAARRAAAAAAAGAGGPTAPGRPGIPVAYARKGAGAAPAARTVSRRAGGVARYSGGVGAGKRRAKRRESGGEGRRESLLAAGQLPAVETPEPVALPAEPELPVPAAPEPPAEPGPAGSAGEQSGEQPQASGSQAGQLGPGH